MKSRRMGVMGWLVILLVVVFGFSGGGSWPALAAAAGDENSSEADCDPTDLICIEVFEDDLEAITARWDGTERIWIVEPPTGYVQIRHKGDTITARRMRLQEENEYAYLEEDVDVWREDARIRSHTLDLWWEREEFIFTGDVMLVQFEDETETESETEKVAMRTVWAQRVEYDGASGDVVAEEDVRMEDDNYRVWAQEMVYREEAEEMLFNDRVRVVSREDDWTMTGQRFFYDLAADEGRLIGPHRIELTPKE